MEITVLANASARIMHIVITWMAHALVQMATKGLCVMKYVLMVHMGFTAGRIASVKMVQFAQMWMVFARVNLDGMVSTVNHSAMLDTMVISVVMSVCV